MSVKRLPTLPQTASEGGWGAGRVGGGGSNSEELALTCRSLGGVRKRQEKSASQANKVEAAIALLSGRLLWWVHGL